MVMLIPKKSLKIVPKASVSCMGTITNMKVTIVRTSVKWVQFKVMMRTLLTRRYILLKFIYSDKATKISKKINPIWILTD